MQAVAQFLTYAVMAVFAENAVFFRALGVSRLNKLVNDPKFSTWQYCIPIILVQTISAPMGWAAQSLALPALAKVLLEGRKYETINLNDYRLNFYGQTLEGDKLDEVIAKMKEADIVVMGSPVYWHNICASVRTLMERFYGYVPDGEFKGKRLFFVYQGAAPTKMMIDDGEYSMSRFAGMYGFSYEGMATS